MELRGTLTNRRLAGGRLAGRSLAARRLAAGMAAWFSLAAFAAPPAAAPPAGAPPAAKPAPATKSAPAAKTGGPDMGRFVPDSNMERADVPAQYKWSLQPLFASDAEFARGLTDAAADRTRLAGFEGKLGDPAALLACLDLYFETRL